MTRKEIWKPSEADTVSAGAPTEPSAMVPAQSPGLARPISASRDRLVFISMGIVTAALAAMLYAQFAFSAPGAILIGAVAWSTFMLVHQQIQKNAQISGLRAELERLENKSNGGSRSSEVGGRVLGAAEGPSSSRSPMRSPRSRQGVPLPSLGPEVTAEPSQPAVRPVDPKLRVSGSAMRPAPQLDQRPDMSRVAGTAAAVPPVLQTQRSGKIEAGPQMPEAAGEAALWPGTSLSASDPMRDQWAFRPRAQTESADAGNLSARSAATMSTPAPNVSLPPPVVTAPISTIETDLAMVQRKIKALADEVNAADVVRVSKSPLPPFPAAPSPPGDLELSIDALKAAAGSMRERRLESAPTTPPLLSVPDQPLPYSVKPNASIGFGELVIPSTAERIAGSQPAVQTPPVPRPADARDLEFELPTLPELSLPPVQAPNIAAIASAIEAGRMDAFLSPIVGLSTHEVSHYEVTVRLKAVGGEHLDHDDDAVLLAGGDLLTLFDIARLNRAASLAARLEARGKTGALLSDVAGPSMTNAAFLESFAHVYEDRETISRQLVLTLPQAATERFTASAWQALGDMHAFGFRFALDKITHLGTDFEDLAQRGFAFVKLDADALLNGLSRRERSITPDEICRRIASAGLSLIAGSIDDDMTRARIFGFGVLLGQGQLFGGARHVTVDPSLARGHSAAA